FADKSFEFFSPLDEQNAPGITQVVEGERIKFTLRIDAVKINVVERDFRAAIFVNQGKRWAGHVFSGSGMEALCNAFDHRALPCCQSAAQQHQCGGREVNGQFAAQRSGFFGSVGGEKHVDWVIE